MTVARTIVMINLFSYDFSYEGCWKTEPSLLIMTTLVLTARTCAPKPTEPELIPANKVAARVVKSACSDEEFLGVVVELYKLEPGVVIIESTTVDPLLTPTILSLPGSIFKNAQIFVINVVGPLLLKKSMTSILNLADSFI